MLARGRGTLVRGVTSSASGAAPTRSGRRDRAHIDRLDNGAVPAIDLNADLAEGDHLTPSDAAVLDAVTSVSVACGFHAGGPSVMRDTAAACVERGVTIGAHVSYRDREHFGRRVVEVDPAQLVEDLTEQCTALAEAADSVGGRVAYLKPHGALYHQMGADPLVAAAVCEAASGQAIGVLVAEQSAVVVEPARRAGLRVVHEGFPDRAVPPRRHTGRPQRRGVGPHRRGRGEPARGLLGPPRRGRVGHRRVDPRRGRDALHPR